MVAINDAFEDNRTITDLLVYGDEKLLWKSKSIRNKGETDECRIDVTGVKVLLIRTKQIGSLRDVHTLWAEPCLYSAK
jgi:hypothetical protein